MPRSGPEPLLALAALAANLLALALPLVTLLLFERVLPTGAMATLQALALGLVAAMAMELALRGAIAALLSARGAAFERGAQRMLIRRMLASGDARTDSDDAGVHVSRLEAVGRLREMRYGDAAVAMINLPFCLLFVAFLYLMSPVVAGVVLGLCALALGLSRLCRGDLHALAGEADDRMARRYSFILETLRNIETVKAMRLEPFMCRRYERLLQSNAAAAAAAAQRRSLAQGAAGAVAQATPVVVATVGAAEVIAQNLSAGALAASILLAGRVMQPILAVNEALAARTEAGRLQRDLARYVADSRPPGRGAAPTGPLRLALSGVALRAGPHAAPVFEGLDFALEPGETVVVSGPSGAGKTVLLHLLMGWAQPTEGTLTVDGAPMAGVDADALQARVGYLAARPRLVAGTILQNMTRFQPERYTEEAMRVADELGLGAYFATHPVGLSHPCGGGAAHGLPKSVEQRVPIVGALAANPDVIVFDEADSMLDAEGDQRLRDCLARRRGRAAMLLVTRRPAYLALADRRLVIENGRLAPVPAGAPARALAS